MKKQISFLIITLFAVSLAQAQLKHDYVWPVGYGKKAPSQIGHPFGGVIIDFNVAPPSMEVVDYIVDRPKAAISDKNGQLVAYTDGCRIANRNHQLMLNGDTLNPGTTFNEFCNIVSYPLAQPTLFLPKPGDDSVYFLFHIQTDNLTQPMNLLYSIVDAKGDNGNGVVQSKNNWIFSDSLFLDSYITATRHANGRDWWVVVPRRLSKGFHVTLLTTNGVEYKGIQYLEIPIDSSSSTSQTAFSTDGSSYLKPSRIGFLKIEFDRCEGKLINPFYFRWDSIPKGGSSVASSLNKRFLYMTSGYSVFQYDLNKSDWNTNVEKIAEYDGGVAPYPTSFYHLLPTPDGKMYITTTFSNSVFHVINNPNRVAPFCQIIPRGLTLPARSQAFLPNFINYNLGPIDGSACDTLGINNLPIAAFHWDIEDSLSLLDVTFTDYSYHEPTSWHWTFGDGQTSQDTNPVHTYAQGGVYEVCLVVSNAYAADTFCRQVQVGATGVHTLPALPHARVWPNPFSSTLNIQLPALVGVSPEFVVYDLYGRVVKTARLTDFDNQIPAQDLPSGLYVWQLRWNGEVTQTGKLVKNDGR
ncbi:MAG: T9SS type A sorting domain-containing protein [Chitinophagales bacterium]|nr:T9SS type A sorting domain-containing protein [Chitinophagales bacterium]